MVNENKNVWPAALLICAVLVLGMFITTAITNDSIKNSAKPVVDFKPVVDAINAQSTKIDNLTTALTPVETNLPSGIVQTERDAEEEKALQLATAYLSDNDFIEELAIKLNSICSDVPDENACGFTNIDEDDLSVVVIESEVDRNNGNYDVTFTVKVLEDYDKLVKMDIGMVVEDVDFDDKFKDAEVDEDSISYVESSVRIY